MFDSNVEGEKIPQNETSCCPYRWGLCSLSQTAQQPVPNRIPVSKLSSGWKDDGHWKMINWQRPYFSSLHFRSEFLDINSSHVTGSPVPRSFVKPLLFSVSGVKLVHSPVFECIWKTKTFYCPSRRATVPFGSISSFFLFLFENVQSYTIYPFRKVFSGSNQVPWGGLFLFLEGTPVRPHKGGRSSVRK